MASKQQRLQQQQGYHAPCRGQQQQQSEVADGAVQQSRLHEGDGEEADALTTPLLKHPQFDACGDLGNAYY